MTIIKHDPRWIDYHGMRVHDTQRIKGRYLRYTVSGRGKFPADMLRYDSAVALTPTDDERGLRHVQIRGTGCTPARWSSFGWSVHPEIEEHRS
jgi:hypothetical protein